MKKIENYADQLVKKLCEKGYTISAAESCTGGLFCASLVSVAGASEVLNQSYITYANEAKHKLLGVRNSTLKKYGAVSKETAREMSIGVRRVAHSDVGIGITGIAGPDGGTKEKPVGLVYISCCIKHSVWVKKCNFNGSRQEVREQAVTYALRMTDKLLDDKF